MWELTINGVTKQQFLDTCFQSIECKRIGTKLRVEYELKKYLLEDINDLKKEYPNIKYSITKC